MEERVPPAGDRKDHHPPPPHEPSFSLPLPPGISLQPPDNYLLRPLPPPPGSETYVIQIPRDQVYRVPPPGNSKIAQSYLQQNQTKKGPIYCIWFLLMIVIFGIFIGALIGIFHLLYNPKLSEFAITNFSVKQLPPQNNKPRAKPGYDISFNVENPNERMDISFRGNGYGLLSFNHHKVADGKFSSYSQEAKKSNNLSITLNGANMALPSEMEKSMNSTKSKKEVSLGFKIFVTTKISSWAKTTNKKITVSCDFKVNTLAKGTRVVDQECITQAQQ